MRQRSLNIEILGKISKEQTTVLDGSGTRITGTTNDLQSTQTLTEQSHHFLHYFRLPKHPKTEKKILTQKQIGSENRESLWNNFG